MTATGSGLKNGSDWSNACDGFTESCKGGSLVRGDTYYVADGDYRSDGAVGFWQVAAGTMRITIKKATIADHGTSTGWLNSMGDGETVFDNIWFDSPYWTFDGSVGSGTSGFGFKINPQKCSGDANVKGIDTGAGNAGIYLLHFEVAHCGEDRLRNGSKGGPALCAPTGTCGLVSDGVYSNNANEPTVDLQIRYAYIHDLTRNGITLVAVSDVLIEHVTVARLHGVDEDTHGQAIQFTQPPQNNVTVRYSTFVDIAGTAALSWLGSNGQTYTNQFVYGNVFYTTADTSAGVKSRYSYSPSALYGRPGTNQSGFQIYNNTFYNVVKPEPEMDGETVSGIDVRNNVYVNSQFTSNPGTKGVTASHNFYFNNSGAYVPTGELGQQNGNADPFVNAADADFRLKLPTLGGFKLDGAYLKDAGGVLRGADGVWDRGAFEFGGTSVKVPLKAPANFKVTPQ